MSLLVSSGQAGLVARIEHRAARQRQDLVKSFLCHWKMKAAAAPFSPSASNFTWPCTLFSCTPLCR